MRLIGLRELAGGVGLLSQPRPSGWLWARVAGDAVDLGLLRLARRSGQVRDGQRLAAATAAVVGVTALDLLAGSQLSRGAAQAAEPGAADQTSQVR